MNAKDITQIIQILVSFAEENEVMVIALAAMIVTFMALRVVAKTIDHE